MYRKSQSLNITSTQTNLKVVIFPQVQYSTKYYLTVLKVATCGSPNATKFTH